MARLAQASRQAAVEVAHRDRAGHQNARQRNTSKGVTECASRCVLINALQFGVYNKTRARRTLWRGAQELLRAWTPKRARAEASARDALLELCTSSLLLLAIAWDAVVAATEGVRRRSKSAQGSTQGIAGSTKPKEGALESKGSAAEVALQRRRFERSAKASAHAPSRLPDSRDVAVARLPEVIVEDHRRDHVGFAVVFGCKGVTNRESSQET
eukprot:6189273-Pleurochrysis_carterae.AAC.1